MPAWKPTAPFLIFLLIVAGKTKIFTRCNLANIIANSVPENFAGYTVNDWICLVSTASQYNSEKISKQKSTSGRNFGLFQFSNMEHCNDGCRSSLNLCRTDCINFLDDDLNDDIRCAMKIIGADNGFEEWRDYNFACKDTNLTRWTIDCSIARPWEHW